MIATKCITPSYLKKRRKNYIIHLNVPGTWLHLSPYIKIVSIFLLGLMVTSAVFYHALWFFNITIDIRNVCVFLAPMFSSFTTLVTYWFTKELKVRAFKFSIVSVLMSCTYFHYYSEYKSVACHALI